MVPIWVGLSGFLSHLSGDEAVNHGGGGGDIFLSHLSGDEALSHFI